MSKIIALQTLLNAWVQAGKKSLNSQITWLMRTGVQNTEKWGCEAREKGASKTTPEHSLNLCNGYAAGKQANLPCKESPFCTQLHQRPVQEQSLWEPVGTGRRREWTQRRTFVSWSDRNWQGWVSRARDPADLGQRRGSAHDTVIPQSAKTVEEKHNTEKRRKKN